MRISVFALYLCVAAFAGGGMAADSPIDENALFSDTTTLVSAKSLSDTQNVKDPSEQKGTSIGGNVTVAPIVAGNRDFINHPRLANTSLTDLLVGSVELDARLQGATKVFGDFEVDYAPSLDSAQRYSLFLRELFLDFTVNHQAYFSVGKQLLQWGRCYFWNPTDLINVEKKPFVDKIGSREGTLGAKMHVPIGTTYNFYAFLDLHSATRADSVALSVKAEYLIGKTEMALSAWGKRGMPVVLGYDISSRVAGIDVTGEMSLTAGGDYVPKLELRDSSLYITTKSSGIVPRICLDLGRSVSFMGFPEAMSFNAEAFYNGGGNSGNVFKDSTKYIVRAGQFLALPDAQKPRATPQEALLLGNLYEQNYYSKYYAALFLSINRFFASDLSCSLNGIMNIEQRSGTVSLALGYTLLNNMTFAGTLIGYLGADNTEYTMFGQSFALQLTAGVRF